MAIGYVRILGAKSVPNLLDKVNTVDIVNDVTSGGTGAPLSAEQGKVLNNAINTEIGNRSLGDLSIIGTASAAYNTLGKIETEMAALDADYKAADTAITNSISGVINTAVANINADIATVKSDLATETTNRTVAVQGEETARIAADSIIQTNLTAEETARIAADNAITSGYLAADSALDAAYKAADISLQADIAAETAARVAAVSTENSDRVAAIALLDSKVNTEISDRISDIALVNSAITTEVSNRTTDTSALASRISAVETGMATGTKFKGSVADLAAFDSMPEAGEEAGWMYVVGAGSSGSRDVYVVVADQTGDYVPNGWTVKSMVWLMDYADVTNVVTAEKTQRVAEDTMIRADISNLTTIVASNLASVNAALSTETANRNTSEAAITAAYTAADVSLQANITAEETSRLADVAALDVAYKAADAALQANIQSEETARIAAVAGVSTGYIAGDATLQANITAEENARIAADGVIDAAYKAADLVLNGMITTETADRIAADAAESQARSNADTALSGRLDIIEGNSTVSGSVQKALLDAKKYADDYIPVPMLEGQSGTLLVVGDTVSLTYAPHRGVSGISLGEVLVYLADGQSQMISVANVVGNLITLQVGVANEFDGCQVKVQYWFINADQGGSGLGLAGSGGAGL